MMWGRWLLIGCTVAAWTAAASMPAFAARTSATDSSYEDNYSYATHRALFGSRDIYWQSFRRLEPSTDRLARSPARWQVLFG